MKVRKWVPLLLVVLCAASAAASDVQVRSMRIDEAMPWAMWGDFNGDGLDDLLRHNKLQWNVGGRLAEPMTVALLEADIGALPEPADLNGDTYADLIIRVGEDRVDRLFLGDGRGAFTEHPLPTEFGRVFQIADVTNDGVADLLTFRVGKLTVLRNNGDATFTLQQELAWPDRNSALRLAIGDLNADGFVDLAGTAENHLYLFYGSANGTFSQPRVRFTRRRFSSLQIADVNGDSRADLAGLHMVETRVSPLLLIGDGAGRFPIAARARIEGAYDPLEYVSNVVVGDFVPGGANELAVADGDGTVFLFGASNGQLREVGRTRLDADRGKFGRDDVVSPRLLRARFRTPGQYDLIAEGTSLDVRKNPPRRVWLVEASGSVSAVAQSTTRSRMRAVGGHADRITGGYDVDVLESSCPINLSALTFEQEGMFVDVGLNEIIRGAEAIYVEGSIWMRLTVVNQGVARELNGILRPAANGFAGTLFEDGATPCGSWQWHKLQLVRPR